MRRLRWNTLRTRMILFTLVAAIPPVVAILLVYGVQANPRIEQVAWDQIRSSNLQLAQAADDWLTMNRSALSELVSLPDIVGMDPTEQKPVLEAMAAAFPHMYLVSTTDMQGVNVARSDAEAPKDYSDRTWYQDAAAGAAISSQTVVGRTSGVPALVQAMPIRNAAGEVIGTGMYATTLDTLAAQVQATRLDETGFAYVVNEQGQALAHPDPEKMAALEDLSADEPVARVLSGETAWLSYEDRRGVEWLAYVQPLSNGWGVVVQQEAREALSAVRLFQMLSWVGLAITIVFIVGLTTWGTGRALRPVRQLTAAVESMAAGDLTQRVEMESQDELGTLAAAFNTMTGRLHELVTGLEQRVAERTAELEQRAAELEESTRQSERHAVQLEAATKVAQAVTTVLEPELMLDRVVHLIAEQFGHYHSGIFTLDETGQWAVLRATNSEGGKRMMAREHKLRVGRQGIVGYATSAGEARLAVDVGADAIHFRNPDLPETRSELALPLIARGQVLGALDVQSTEPNAFDEQEMIILRALADQVAVALDNAQLYQSSVAALSRVEAIQREYVEQGWQREKARRSGQVYRYRGNGDGDATLPAEAVDQARGGETVSQGAALVTPIRVRGQVIGALGLDEGEGERQWSADEITLVEEVADQVAQAMEAARLFGETRQRARQQQMIAEITARIRAAADMDGIMRTAVQELRRALNANHGVIRLGTETHLIPAEANNGKGES